MSNKLTVFITHDTVITAVENTDEINPAGTSTITSAGYELTYSSGTHKISRDFYVQNFYHYTGIGLGNTFLGAGVIFRSIDTTAVPEDNPTLTKTVESDPVMSMLKRGSIVSAAGGSGNRSLLQSERIPYIADSTTDWTLSYIPASMTNTLVYSNALRAYHYIQSIIFNNNPVNENKRIRVYSYYIYRNASGKIITVLSSNYSQDKMYETNSD